MVEIRHLRLLFQNIPHLLEHLKEVCPSWRPAVHRYYRCNLCYACVAVRKVASLVRSSNLNGGRTNLSSRV